MHTSRAVLLALGTATVLVGLSGCGPSSPEPDPAPTVAEPTSPSPSPTLDAAEAAEQRDVREAEAMLAEFVAARNAVGGAGYGDWTPLSEYLSGDLRPAMVADFADYAAAGIRDAGETVLDGTELAEHLPAPDGAGGTVVVLDACLDTSQADMVDATGASVLDPDRELRYLVTYRTIQDAEGRWTVTDTDPHPDRSC